MRSVTAVEIGADTCAFARTSVKRGDVHLWTADALNPGAFPGLDAFTQAIRERRRTLKLPRTCRAVVWGLPDGGRRRDPSVLPLIEPLTRAGFNVTRVVTPCNALGALSRLRVSRAGGAMCWLGINRNGVAIIVVRPGKLLYSHSFAWNSNVGASGSQARLLQRYSLVSFLAPEVRRAIDAARQKGTTVDGIVTCGNLPDLRSLTMPLIEELDIEVETLDSLEGLVVSTETADRLGDQAPSIRLACAGAIARETRTVDEAERLRARRKARLAALLPIVALVALLAGAGYWYFVLRGRPSAPARTAPPPAPKTAAGGPAKGSAVPPKADATSQRVDATAKADAVPPRTDPGPPKVPAVPSNVPAVPPKVAAVPPKDAAIPPKGDAMPSKPSPSPSPVRTVPPPPVQPPSSAARGGDARQPLDATAKPKSPPASPPSAPPPVSRAAPGTGTLSPSPSRTDKPDTARTASVPPRTPLPELLKDPVPRVTAILISADRRLATIGDQGQIIAVGDTIGRRVVVRIEDKSVLLREPSGAVIRVALGGRVERVER